MNCENICTVTRRVRCRLEVDQGQRQRELRQVAFSVIHLRQSVAQCIFVTSIEPIFSTNVRMMLDTFFIAVEAFDIITVQLPVVDIESRMGI
jgi:hypothetical protein